MGANGDIGHGHPLGSPLRIHGVHQSFGRSVAFARFDARDPLAGGPGQSLRDRADACLIPSALQWLRPIVVAPQPSSARPNRAADRGAEVRSLTLSEAIAEITERHTALRHVDMFSLRAHYADTLRLWRERFMQRRATLSHIGFDEVFARMWELLPRDQWTFARETPA